VFASGLLVEPCVGRRDIIFFISTP
jgi:hypothetical protein